MLRVFRLIIFLVPLACSAELALTPVERAFLEEHPVIHTWYSDGSPALEFEEDGHPAGYTIDYLRLVAKTAGFEIDFGNSFREWKDTEKAFHNRDIDFLTGTVAVERYRDYALFTNPYLFFQRVYVVRKEDPQEIRSPSDLIGRRVAVVESLPFVDVWRKNWPDIDFVPVDSSEEMVAAVADGRADATFTFKSTYDLVTARHGFSNLRVGGVEGRTEGLENCFRIAVRKDWPELRTILDKAMDAIPQEQRNSLWSKWFGEHSRPPIIWTNEELSYLKAHPVLRYSTLPDAAPIEYLDKNGKPAGLTIDYVKLMEKYTGIRIEDVPVDSRAEKMENLRSGRCDFLPTFATYDVPTSDYLFTDVYMEFPLVVATRIDVPYINTLKDCAGQRVGLVARIGVLKKYQARFPGVEFSSCKSVAQGLREVSQGKLFGVIGPQPVVAYQIQELYFGNLKITGTLDESLKLSAVIRSEDRPLQGILDKVIKTVTSEEQRHMLDRRISIRFEQGFDYRLFWKFFGGTAVLLFFIVFRYHSVAKFNRKLCELNGELAKSLEERDRIMSVISHDLRQPLQGMGMFLELLEEGGVDPKSGPGRVMVRQTRARSERVYCSLENLLGWLGARNRTLRPRFEILPLRDMVEDALAFLHTQIRDKEVRVDNEVPGTVLVEADERMLAAILRNLIANAAKFSNPGNVVEINAETAAGGWRIQVVDRGMGMEPDRIKAILLDQVVSIDGTGGEKGAGLGLQLCRAFLAAMESELGIESVSGQGSVFSFVLKAG